MTAEAMEAVPCNEALSLSFEEFQRLSRDDAAHCYYLQTSLVADEGRFSASEGLKADLEGAMASPLWREVSAALGRPSWLRSQLFVGPEGTLGCAHFDQYDNIFLQVRGSKRMLLVDPRAGAQGLRPFPVHHPYDQRARMDLERTGELPEELRGAGVEVLLRPGEAVYIPSHWWHHVEAASPSISVNFWLDTVTPRLLSPPPQLRPQLEMELARQVEYLVGDAFGSEAVAGFMAALAEEAGCVGAQPPSEGPWLPVLNYVFRQLALTFGPAAVCGFLEDYLSPRRWQGLQRVCF